MMEYILMILFLLSLGAIAAMVMIIRVQINKVKFYEQWIEVFKRRVEISSELIQAADIRGSFEADDEIGDAFKNIKAVVEDLQKFTE